MKKILNSADTHDRSNLVKIVFKNEFHGDIPDTNLNKFILLNKTNTSLITAHIQFDFTVL